MSKANPRKAMAALLPPGGAEIRPMTLGVYAALERIESPLVTGKEPKDTLELIPSLYLLTHDPREVFRGNILDLAMQWADTQPVGAVERIREAAERQMAAFFDVVPQNDEKKKTAPMTAGSPRSSTGRRVPTAGASRKSCGASRRAPSRSSADRSGKTRTASSSASRSVKSKR